ncbi:SOS response-associated peptidase [Antribacter gilvus]|uniref:SOS response-associated peptidase n=1 Tax=Antribacter gilvus TaxID=2304675 RepID=UPI000F76C60B|nr:SOS response-associated peptidase [Antribacter gilvus]
MCGRFASFRDAQDLADEFALADVADDARLLPPSWNVAPTDPVRIVVERAAKDSDEVVRSMRVARWGLVPSWAKDPSVGSRMFNARAESLAGKPAFAKPFAVRRCLVPADGYFEWRKLPDPRGGGDVTAGSGTGRASRVPKQAYWIHPPASGVAALAGLYEFWKDPSKDPDDPARWVVSATVVTTASSGTMELLHDRTPLVLPAGVWDAWLSPDVGADEAAGLLRATGVRLEATPVRDAVGSVQNNGPELVEPDPEPRDPEVVRL